eukprot:TRINITY_DN4587_c0_g3_i1.p1 TRINITY_DN4587_c0_g3~~TRINITY_DN4587_c0_g3_i1.p1  ORF type:complete len:596 (+),score=190.15 TRINITY_DN4587_c0_g3_i1:111-1790(+)
MAAISGRATGAPVGSYWERGDRRAEEQRDMPEAESLRGVDACRRVLYDDLLTAAARRSYGGMDLSSVNDARKQYYENHKALRLEHQRERDRQWEHEKFIHAERMMDGVRSQDRSQQREHEWERVFKAEQARQHEVEMRFEEEKLMLRDDWEQEKRFEKEKEQQRAREWEQVREAERRRMRQKLDEFKDECARERRQQAERQLQWEAEKERYVQDWKDDDAAERAAWERWYQQLKEEHQLRKRKWEAERADMRKEYMTIEGPPAARSARASIAGEPEQIQHEDRPSPAAVKDMLTWTLRSAKKAEGPPAVAQEIINGFWLFVRHDSDSDGVLDGGDLQGLAEAVGMARGDAILEEIGPTPYASIDAWVNWLHSRRDDSAAAELVSKMGAAQAVQSCRPMTEAELEEHFQTTTDTKLEAGAKNMRKVWSALGSLREREQEEAEAAQEKLAMEAAIGDKDGSKLILELEASPEYTQAGFAAGELEGILEAHFNEASRGASLSFTDGTFDRMLARMHIDDFTPQERAVTQKVWGNMDFEKFLCWLSTRRPPDRKRLQLADILS